MCTHISIGHPWWHALMVDSDNTLWSNFMERYECLKVRFLITLPPSFTRYQIFQYTQGVGARPPFKFLVSEKCLLSCSCRGPSVRGHHSKFVLVPPLLQGKNVTSMACGFSPSNWTAYRGRKPHAIGNSLPYMQHHYFCLLVHYPGNKDDQIYSNPCLYLHVTKILDVF